MATLRREDRCANLREKDAGYGKMPATATKGMSKRHVFLISDSSPAANMLVSAIREQDDLEMCGKATDLPGFLVSVKDATPDVAVLDISSAREEQSSESLRSIKSLVPGIPILLVSYQDENLYAEAALRAGARGYIMRHESTETMLAAIRRVLSGDIYLSQKLASRMLQEFVNGRKADRENFGVESLSDRELEIFELIGLGLSTRKIADRLKLSVKTIETHRAHVKQKLKLSDAADLVHRAFHWANSRSTG